MSERLRNKIKEKPLFSALERDYLAAVLEGTIRIEELANVLSLSDSSVRNRHAKIGNIIRERIIKPAYGFEYKGDLTKLRIIKLLNYFNLIDYINPDITKPFPLIVDPGALLPIRRESIYLYSEGMNVEEIAYILGIEGEGEENEIRRGSVNRSMWKGIKSAQRNKDASDSALGQILDLESYTLTALAYMRNAKAPKLLGEEIQPQANSFFSILRPATAPVLKEYPVPPLFLMPLDDAKSLYHYAIRPQIVDL